LSYYRCSAGSDCTEVKVALRLSYTGGKGSYHVLSQQKKILNCVKLPLIYKLLFVFLKGILSKCLYKIKMAINFLKASGTCINFDKVIAKRIKPYLK
jgi:hypothetical protein